VSARSGRLYELVGAGMAGWSRAVHRGVAVGIERLRLEPGVVLASTHPSDADPPVVAGALYRDGRLWRHPERIRPAFAVRNDLLLPGFFAGYPPWMPAWARRALYPVGIGPILAGQLLCLPVRFSDRLRLVEALRACPDADLATVLPPARCRGARATCCAASSPTCCGRSSTARSSPIPPSRRCGRSTPRGAWETCVPSASTCAAGGRS
jgi:hypothetical protein